MASACGYPESESDRDETARRFAVDVRPLNGSNIDGRGELSLVGKRLTVDVEAGGLASDRIHEQHLNGLAVADQEATCPSDADDDDGDGLVELGEARSELGSSIEALEPFPTVGDRGRLDYELAFTVDPEQLEPLENRLLVVRGLSTGQRGTRGGRVPAQRARGLRRDPRPRGPEAVTLWRAPGRHRHEEDRGAAS